MSDKSGHPRVMFTTDSLKEAWDELQRRRRTGEKGWDMAEVRRMEHPPRTTNRYAVFNVASSRTDRTED